VYFVECSVVCRVDTLCLKYLLEYLISGDVPQDYSSPHLDIKIQLYCSVSLFIGKVKHSNLHLVKVTIVRHQDLKALISIFLCLLLIVLLTVLLSRSSALFLCYYCGGSLFASLY
jgi:hypothetical protein